MSKLDNAMQEHLVYTSGQDPRKKIHRGIKSEIEDWILLRIDVVEQNPDLIIIDRKTVNTVFYDVRDKLLKLGFKISLRMRQQITGGYIKEICKLHGYKRAELGIIAADKAELYFEGQTYDIGIKEMQDLNLNLKGKGTDLIIIEKEGVVEALGPYADKYGIALMYTRGFASEYAKELIDLALIDGAHLWLITDYDIGGINIWLDIIKECNEVKRIAVDFEILEYLFKPTKALTSESGIVKKFTEDYEHKQVQDKKTGRLKQAQDTHLIHLYTIFGEDNKHIRYLEPVKGGSARRRIEIDKVLKEVGNERFWNFVVHKLQPLRRNYNRSIDVIAQANILFPEMKTVSDMLELARSNILKDSIKKEKNKLSNYSGLIDNVPEYKQAITDYSYDKLYENKTFESFLDEIKILTDQCTNESIFQTPEEEDTE